MTTATAFERDSPVVEGANQRPMDGLPRHLAGLAARRLRLHQGAIWGGFAAPVLVWFASAYDVSLATAMLIGTVGGLISFILAVFCGPDTKGKVLVADLVVT